MRLLRLDKFLCESRGVSRETARQMIRAGRVLVDGTAQKRPETKVDPAAQTVLLDGEALSWARQRYYLLHKPLGVVTATEDAKEKTVLDLFPPELRRGLVPAGRLDKDTSGLLLLSTDGDWVHRVISPRHEVEKVYLAETDGELTEEDVSALAAGVVLRDGTKCLPAKLELLDPGSPLKRGYSLTFDAEGRIVRAAEAVKPGDRLTTRLGVGEITSVAVDS